jgi:hypothetical protein
LQQGFQLRRLLRAQEDAAGGEEYQEFQWGVVGQKGLWRLLA